MVQISGHYNVETVWKIGKDIVAVSIGCCSFVFCHAQNNLDTRYSCRSVIVS